MRMKLKIVIIEDELLTSDDLKNILMDVDSDINIVAQLQSVSEAFEFFSAPQDFDLIFSDIKLGDGLSFEIFEKMQLDKPVIFCTAYNDYALEAFSSNGIDYLLKPFGTDTVEKALTKFRESHLRYEQINRQLPLLLNDLGIDSKKGEKKILVEKGRRRIPIPIAEFAIVYIEDRIIFGLTYNQKEFILPGTLDSIHLDFGKQFFRVNRKYLVHKNSVVDAIHTNDRKLKLNLRVDHSEVVVIGKMKATEFLKWLVN